MSILSILKLVEWWRHFDFSTRPHLSQCAIFCVFVSHCSQTPSMVSFLQFSQKYIGSSASIIPISRALWNDLILPPCLPTGNIVCGSPSSFLVLAFSGLPILAPINVPDLSLIFISDMEFILSSTSSTGEFLYLL